jgi:hypothetical protein
MSYFKMAFFGNIYYTSNLNEPTLFEAVGLYIKKMLEAAFLITHSIHEYASTNTISVVLK